jgi:hypothetical protein
MVKRNQWWAMLNLKSVVVVFAGALLLVSCGIFSPRSTEPPSQNVVHSEDPFHFQSILAGTNQSFSKPQYEDLFTGDFSYIDNNSRSYTRDEFIRRIKQLALSNASLHVIWKSGTFWREGDTLYTLNGLTYSVFVQGDTTGASDAVGTSDFTIVKNLNGDNYWHISSWRDVPSSPGKSFFAP